MNQYVLYKNTKDYPNKYVIRKFTIKEGHIVADDQIFAIGDTYLEVASKVPNLYFVPRDINDDPVIEGVFI